MMFSAALVSKVNLSMCTCVPSPAPGGTEPYLPFLIKPPELICTPPFHDIILATLTTGPWCCYGKPNSAHKTPRSPASKSLPSALITITFSSWCCFLFHFSLTLSLSVLKNSSSANVFHLDCLKDFWKQYCGTALEAPATKSHVISFKDMSSLIASLVPKHTLIQVISSITSRRAPCFSLKKQTQKTKCED